VAGFEVITEASIEEFRQADAIRPFQTDILGPLAKKLHLQQSIA